MAQPFKFRYVNEIVGTFVLLVLIILLVGIFLAGQSQQWFESVHRYTLIFPPEGSLGLQESSEVVILGAVVGSLEKLSVDSDGNMTGRIAIKGDFFRFVREDSKVIVKKKFVLAGDSYIDITKGTGAPLPEGSSLTCAKDTEITEFLEIEVEKVMEEVIPVIEQTRLAIEEYTRLAADIRDPGGSLQQLLGNLNRITEGLAAGEGMAGAVLRDPGMTEDLKEIVRKLKEMTERLQVIADDAARTVHTFPPMAETIAGEVEDVPGLVLQSRETLRETQRLIEALQRHWLIRGYVDRGEGSSRIPVSSISIGE
ncbi:MAG: MlaD family protein [PVC group bacterium]